MHRKKNLSLLTALGTAFIASSAFACPDTNGDDVVDVQDLTNVILDWGSDGSGNNGDANTDGIVDVQDLTLVILSWGPFECPSEECVVEPGAPANDCCGTATAVNGTGLVSMPFDTTNANTDGPDDPSNPCSSGGTPTDTNVWKDVWFLYTVDEDGQLIVSNCLQAEFDSKIAVYALPDGAECDHDTLIANTVGCNEDCAADGTFFTSEFSVGDVLAGEQYLVRLGGFSADATEDAAEFGAGTISFNLLTSNDICDAAADIAPGDTVEDSTCDSQISGDAPICAGGIAPSTPGRWYQVVGDGNTLEVTTCDTVFMGSYGTAVDIYCGGAEGVECADIECIGTTSPVCGAFFTQQSFCSIEGNTYFIHVYANSNLPDPCGDFIIGVTSDDTSCEDFTECDQPGCADPTVIQSGVIAQTTLVSGSPLGITQDSNTGTIYVLDLFNRTFELLTFDGASYTSVSSVTFDPDETVIPPIQDDADPPGNIHAASGITYDSVNDTLWIMVDAFNGDLGGGAGQGWIMYEVTFDGTATGNTIPAAGVGAETGLSADVEHDPVTDTFWYQDIVADEVIHISRAGTQINTVPQSCIDDGSGVFGNGCDISGGILETLVGPGSSAHADRAVPISQVDGSNLEDCPFTCDSVTDLHGDLFNPGCEDAGNCFNSGIVRDRLDPSVMHIVGSAGDFIAAVEAAPQPAP